MTNYLFIKNLEPHTALVSIYYKTHNSSFTITDIQYTIKNLDQYISLHIKEVGTWYKTLTAYKPFAFADDSSTQ